MNKEKAKQLIYSELQTCSLRKVLSSDRAMVACPFHNDRTPSGGINLDIAESKAPLGWFRCFGCGTSVSWNDFATKAGLKKLSTNKNNTDYLSPESYREHLLGEEDSMSLEEQITKLEFFDFQIAKWRGFDTSFLETYGAKYCYYDTTGDFYVWFPVNVFKKLRGFVKAKIKKVKGETSFINASGKWSEKHGLLFFDEALELSKRLCKRTLVLCEGPRDALRCLEQGIPAVAVLGALNWNESKRLLLEKADYEKVILFFDGDEAGKLANKKVKTNLKTYFDIKQISLWKTSPGDDPFTCDIKYLKFIKRHL